jgi:hypothetical protein
MDMRAYTAGIYDVAAYLAGSYGYEELGNSPTTIVIDPTYPEAT